MSAWTSATDLRAQMQKRWDKGELLAERAMPAALFPLRLTVRTPTSTELSERFDEVRSWAAALQQGARSGYRLAFREVRHRVIGHNSVPAEAWVDTLDDALRLIGKVHEARSFDALLQATQQQQPKLVSWLQRQPLRALALEVQWPQLLALVAWVKAHPRPGIYLREVDLAGIHSKFVEAQRSVLTELLDLVLPVEAIDDTCVHGGRERFIARYGFRDKPLRVRFRCLDPKALAWAEGGDGDYTVSQSTFARMAPAVERVLITENEINFLALPHAEKTLAIFGSGYGFEMLEGAAWLQRCELHYWGDLDTHGFAILDQLRARHPHVRSFLMDRRTLLLHEQQWTTEPKPTARELVRLNPDEQSLYDDLRRFRLRAEAVRLEQERIRFGLVVDSIEALSGDVKALQLPA